MNINTGEKIIMDAAISHSDAAKRAQELETEEGKDMDAAISCTDAAAKRVQELLAEEGNYNLKLRVYITGGGCSGFQYGFAFDENLKEDDTIVSKVISLGEETVTINVVVDALSMMYLVGAQIDYQESLQGAHFIVTNPNAQTTCSCGSSFAL